MRDTGTIGLRRRAAAAAACALLVLLPQAFAGTPHPGATGEDVSVFLQSAQAAIAEERYQDAEHALDNAMSLHAMSPRELGLALYLRGQLRYALGEVHEAMADWRRALDEGELAPSQAEAIRQGLASLEAYLKDDMRGGEAGLAASLMQRAGDALMAEDFARAHDLAARALTEAEASGSAVLVLQALGSLGVAESALGEFEAAAKTFERAAAEARDQENLPVLLLALIGQGDAAMAADSMSVGADAYRQATELFERLQDDAGTRELMAFQHAYAALGQVAIINREYADAAMHLSRALELEGGAARGIGGTAAPFETRAQILANAALAAFLQGDAAQANLRLEQLRREAAERNAVPVAARTIERTSEFARYIGDHQIACTFERRARDLYATLGLRNDADDMRVIMEEAGCPGTGASTDPE